MSLYVPHGPTVIGLGDLSAIDLEQGIFSLQIFWHVLVHRPDSASFGESLIRQQAVRQDDICAGRFTRRCYHYDAS